MASQAGAADRLIARIRVSLKYFFHVFSRQIIRGSTFTVDVMEASLHRRYFIGFHAFITERISICTQFTPVAPDS